MPRGIYPRTIEHRQNVSKAKKGSEYKKSSLVTTTSCEYCNKEFSYILYPYMLKEKLLRKYCSRFCTGASHKGQVTWCSGLTKETDPRVAKIALISKNKVISDEHKEKIRQSNMGRMISPVTREKLKISHLGKHHSEETIKKILRNKKNVKPNKPERKLLEILDSLCPNEFEYNGTGKVIILGMVPDFININGKKQVIELFGDYWHSSEVLDYNNNWKGSELGRILAYGSVGFDCLVIWEHELKDIPTVKEKVKLFGGGK